MKFIAKISVLKNIITKFPGRLRRLLLHFTFIFPFVSYKLPACPSGFFEWFLDLMAYVNDLIGFTDILHTTHLFMKKSFRKLTNEECVQMFEIFRNSVDYSQVWIDPSSRIGLSKLARAYVLFNTINYQREIDFPTLAHEMMHIWQYQNYGSMYLGRALRAQYLLNPYDFGGVQNLYTHMIEGKKMADYNFEQQGAIIEHLVMAREEQYSHPILSAVSVYYLSQLIDIP